MAQLRNCKVQTVDSSLEVERACQAQVQVQVQAQANYAATALHSIAEAEALLSATGGSPYAILLSEAAAIAQRRQQHQQACAQASYNIVNNAAAFEHLQASAEHAAYAAAAMQRASGTPQPPARRQAAEIIGPAAVQSAVAASWSKYVAMQSHDLVAAAEATAPGGYHCGLPSERVAAARGAGQLAWAYDNIPAQVQHALQQGSALQQAVMMQQPILAAERSGADSPAKSSSARARARAPAVKRDEESCPPAAALRERAKGGSSRPGQVKKEASWKRAYAAIKKDGAVGERVNPHVPSDRDLESGQSFMVAISKFMSGRGTPISRVPTVGARHPLPACSADRLEAPSACGCAHHTIIRRPE